jgi:anti-sigma B factor antagonist
MEVTTERFRRVSVVKARGRVDSSTAPKLAEAFTALTNDGQFRIVFDMSEVDFISSVGLRLLLDTQRTCRRLGRGQVVLATPAKQILKTLDLAGFNTLFDVYGTLLEAVGSV